MANDVFVGNVAVGVVPDARGWNQELRAQLVPSADTVGQEVGRTISKRVVDSMGAAGTESAGAFDKTFKARLKAALDSLPKAKIDADSTDADRKVAELRARLEELSHTDVIDSKAAMRELAVIDAGLKDLSRNADIRVRFNTTEARAQLALLNRDLGKAGSGGGVVSRLGGLFGGGGAAAAAGGAASGGTSGLPVIGNALGALPPEAQAAVIGGIGTAVAVSLPFIGQMVAGAVVTGFGAGLAGLAIYGAAQYAPVTKAFDAVKTKFSDDLKAIGKAFVPVLISIAGVITGVLHTLTPVFAAAAGVISKPFQEFADALIRSFGDPAVQQSVKVVAVAFGGLLKALTPDIPGIVDGIAGGITSIANAVAKNPKAFADFIKFMADVIIWSLRIIAGLTLAANWIEAHWSRIGPVLKLPFDAAVAFIKIDMGLFRAIIGTALDLIQGKWSAAWNNMRTGGIQVWNAIRNLFTAFWHAMDSLAGAWGDRLAHDIAAHFAEIRHDFAQWSGDFLNDTRITWNDVYGATIGSVIRQVHDVESWYNSLKAWIINFFRDAGSWLVGAGEAVIQGFWNGMLSTWHKVTGWIGGLAGWIKAHKGPLDADLQLLQPAGLAIMAGLRIGLLGGFVQIKDVIGSLGGNIGAWLASSVGKGLFGRIVSQGLVDISKIPSALMSAAGAIGGFFSRLVGGSSGGGVGRWGGLVAKALGMLGLPASLAPRVLYQMQTESGGNPNAINLSDINAQMGDPSRGLLQVIGGTFSAYHVPGTSLNIYDPLANIAAAINYAAHRYGPSLMSGGMGMGSGHGYDEGGWLPPGVTTAVNNTRYPELILSPQQLASGLANGPTYQAFFDGLTGAAIESHVRTAFQAMALAQGNLQRQGRRNLQHRARRSAGRPRARAETPRFPNCRNAHGGLAVRRRNTR